MKDFEQLTNALASMPGLGPRQAKRLAYFLITEKQNISSKLIRTLTEAREHRQRCEFCQGVFFDQDRWCRTCRDSKRDSSQLMIVENDIDKESTERSGVYHGHYFILGGSLPVTETRLAENLVRLKQLDQLLSKYESIIQEMILAFNYTPQGEHTAELLKKWLQGRKSQGDFKITTLGRGLSSGTELEYSDADTLKSAWENRK